MTSVRALSVVAGACLASASEPNFELFVTEAAAENVPSTCFTTSGMPSYVQGKYIVSGPARWSQSDKNGKEYKLKGIFDGFGKVNMFEVKDGQVCYSNKWMNTTIAREAEDYGYTPGMLFEESDPQRPLCPLFDPLCEANVVVDNNWVNLIQIDGKAIMLSDTPHFLEMDLDTLDIQGNYAWTDDLSTPQGMVMDWKSSLHIVATGSAHPIPFPNSNTYVDVVTQVATGPGKAYLSVYTFQGGDVGEAQGRTLLANLPFSHSPYLHTFGVTDNYIVLPVNQKIGIPSINKPVLLGLVTAEWQGIHVLSRDGTEVMSFDCDEFVHVHIINSYEDETGIVLDLGAYPDTPFQLSGAMDIELMLDKNSRDSNALRANLRRYHLHLTGDLKGQVTVVAIPSTWNAHVDFYRMNAAYYGKPYCYFYATEWWHDGTNYASMAIVKTDVCRSTTTHWAQTNFYVGEPYFIASGGSAEDDGVVVFIGIDGNRGASSFVTLDAKTMTEIDGAGVELPFHIPFTAHGEFISSPSVSQATVV